jgi:hypothetical protein
VEPVKLLLFPMSYAVSLITPFVTLAFSALSSLSLLIILQGFKVLQHSGNLF